MKFTQRESLHMMGEGFSIMGFDVFADGKPTQISRFVRTSGRSGGFKTEINVLVCGDDEFDLRVKHEPGEMERWLRLHVEPQEADQPAGDIPWENTDTK